MTRRSTVYLVLLVLGTMCLPARAEPKSHIEVWVVEHTAPGTGAMRVEMTFDGGVDGDAGVASFLVRGRGRAATLQFARLFAYGAEPNRVYGPVEVTRCSLPAPAAMCATTGAGTGWIEVTPQGDENDPDHLYLVLRGETITVALDAAKTRGWRLRRLPKAAARFAVPTGTDAVGVSHQLPAPDVEAFRYVEAPGGGRGSYAAAAVPCEFTTDVGQLTLRGGAKDVVSTCPLAGRPLFGQADAATTWIVDGAAVGGVSSGRTRLVVLDLP